MSTAPSPWDIDYFAPPTPHVAPPSPKAKAPKPVPEPEALFMVQRHTLQILNDIEALKQHLGHHQDRHLGSALQKLETDAQNTYKVIRRYLAENVSPGQGDFSA